MVSTKPDFDTIVWSLLAYILLAGSSAFGLQQGQLSGIHGLPVEGHDIVAGIEIRGTKAVDHRRIRDRLRSNGADLRLGWPLETQTLCRFKEVLRDVMGEKGFPAAVITHETRPAYGNPRHLILKFTIAEGSPAGGRVATGPRPSPAERCSR